MFKNLTVVSTISCVFLLVSPCEAAFSIKQGKIVNTKNKATTSVHEHFAAGQAALHSKQWAEARDQFRIVCSAFPGTTFAQDAEYLLALAYYWLEEYEFSNKHIDNYLKEQGSPKHFDDAVRMKFACAQRFRGGAKRRIFGSEQFPKCLTGRTKALQIFDEVVAAAPSSDIAAMALDSKAELLHSLRDFRGSIETRLQLIKRFPKHELTPDAFVAISKDFVLRAESEFQNPDILALTRLNAEKFKQAFPGETRHKEVEANVLKVKELYAKGLFDTGRFYERVKRPEASAIYYGNAIKQFPETNVAEACRQRLEQLRESQHSNADSQGVL